MDVSIFYPLLSVLLTTAAVLSGLLVVITVLVWSCIAVILGVRESRRARQERIMARGASDDDPLSLFE